MSEAETLWIVDTSLSMTIEDIPWISPNHRISRLDRAKELIEEGIMSISGTHAIMSYAREAYMETPFTEDRSHLTTVIGWLEGTRYFWGSDMVSPLLLTDSLYRWYTKKVHIIWLSDGGALPWDFPSIPPGFDMTIVGIGSQRGEKIPLWYAPDGTRRYRTFSGSEVVVPYEKDILETLSRHYDADFIDMGIETSFPEALRTTPLPKNEKNIFLYLGSMLIIFGYLYHPYARKK